MFHVFPSFRNKPDVATVLMVLFSGCTVDVAEAVVEPDPVSVVAGLLPVRFDPSYTPIATMMAQITTDAQKIQFFQNGLLVSVGRGGSCDSKSLNPRFCVAPSLTSYEYAAPLCGGGGMTRFALIDSLVTMIILSSG